MVIATYPLAKIGLLLLKQLSKPLANRIKTEAKKHPKIRKYVVIPTGKAYNYLEMKTLGSLKGTQEYEKLTEEEFVELGSNALGEFVLFGMLTIILLAEINRQGDKKATQAKLKEEELVNLVDTVVGVIQDLDEVKKQVKEIDVRLKASVNAIDIEELGHELVTDENLFEMFTPKYTYKKYLTDFDEFQGISA